MKKVWFSLFFLFLCFPLSKSIVKAQQQPTAARLTDLGSRRVMMTPLLTSGTAQINPLITAYTSYDLMQAKLNAGRLYLRDVILIPASPKE